MMKRWARIGVALWLPLGALAQEAEVFPLPESPPPGDTRFEAGQDEDEVNIPVLPGTAAVQPPPATSVPDESARDLSRSVPARPEALHAPAIGGDQLPRFARAYRQIETIHARYARLMPAADELERQSLAEGGNAEMRAAIQQAGLTVAQYNAISLRRWEDAAFARTLNDVLAQNP
jgi:ferric-dicitrate binding protein FerR (iron transport regulator)